MLKYIHLDVKNTIKKNALIRKKGLKDHSQTYIFATETEKVQVNLQIYRFRLCKI